MKKWTQRQARSGNLVSPDAFNKEFRAQQSSITTLDRTQYPPAILDDANLTDYALHRVWHGTTAEQTADVDTAVASNMWRASTFQVHAGGWTLADSATLTGFKGGNLYIEWAFNAYVQNIFARGNNDGYPGSPAYLRARILINGVSLVERRGTAYHEHMRVLGAGQFPPGDLAAQLEFRLTEGSQDCALTLPAGFHLLQAHIWNIRYLGIGRWR